MRRVLDRIYIAALWLAGLAMLSIAVLVFLQVAGRVLDRGMALAGAEPLGFAIPSLAEFGGFLFVAAAFLALPATFRAGVHVRVTLLGGVLPGALARWVEIAVIAGAAALAGFAAWHSGAQVADSLKFSSVSYGTIPVPLWIPQAAMTAGLGLMLTALVDELVVALRGGVPSYRAAELERAASGEGE